MCICIVFLIRKVMYQTRKTVFDHISKLLTNFEVFGDVVKYGLECLMYLLNRN